MKVLIVCSGNAGSISPFIIEQAKALADAGIQIDYLVIKGKGILGYLKNIPKISQKIKEFSPHLIHAHYGLSGFIASFQKKIPLVTTYHGSDVNLILVRILSYLAAQISTFNIFVEEKLSSRVRTKRACSIIPCGVNLHQFYPLDKTESRAELGLDYEKKYLLFSSQFDNPVKNVQLLVKALSYINDKVEVIELKNRSRVEVNLLLNACDVAILTSKSEGSPQFIKEAMACNCPVVATDVGDIKSIVGETEGCYVASFNPKNVAEQIKKALEFCEAKSRTNGREKIKHLDNQIIAQEITRIYQQVLSGALILK